MAIAGKITAAKAEVRFSADTGAVKVGIRQVERELKGLQSRSSKMANLGAQVRGLGEGVTRFGRRMSMAGVAAAAPFALAAKAVGDFDREFSSMKVNFGKDLGNSATKQIAGQLRGVTDQAKRAQMQLGQVKKMLGGFRNQTLDIATELPVTPKQVAKMASSLARAGVKSSTVFDKSKTGGSVIKAFAQAASVDLSGADPQEVTEGLLSVMKALGKLDDKAGKGFSADAIINDVATLAAATTKANVSVMELTEALKFPGGVLSNNIQLDPKQFKELVAVASLLKEGLASSSIAGTSLRGMTLKLRSAQEGDETDKQLKRFGLDFKSFRTDDGKGFLSLTETIRKLEDSRKMFTSDAEFDSAIGGLFDTRQVSAAIKLLTVGADKIEKKMDSITFSDGEAVQFLQDFTDEMNNNLAGSITRTISSLQKLGIKLGDTFKVEAMGAMQGIINAISMLTDKGKSGTSFLQEQAQNIKRIILGVGAVVALGAAISAVGVALSTVSLPIIAFGLLMPQIAKSGALLKIVWSGIGTALKGLVVPLRNAAKEFRALNAAATQDIFRKAEMGRTARATQLPVVGRNVGFDNAMDPRQRAATSGFADLQKRRKAANAALSAANLDGNTVFKKNKVAETESRKQLARARKVAKDKSRLMSPVPNAQSATRKRSKAEQAQLRRAKKAVKAFKAENAAKSVSVVTTKKAAETGKKLAASNKKVSKSAAKAAKANANVSVATKKASKATRKAAKGVGLTGAVQSVAKNKKAQAEAAKAAKKAASKASEKAAAAAAAAALPVESATEDLRKARAAHNKANAGLRRNLKSLGASSALIGGAPKDAASLKRVKVAEANLREAKRQAKRLLNAGKTDLDILRAKKKTLKSMNSGLKSLNQGMGPVLTPGFGALSKSEKLSAANHRFSQSMPVLNRRAMGGVIDIAQMKKESKFLKDKPKRIAAANKEFAKTMPILNRRAMGGVIDIAQMKKEAARLSSERAKLAVGERAKQQAKLLMANQALGRLNNGRGAVLNKRVGLGGVIEQRKMEQQAEKINKAQLKRDAAQARSFKAQEIANRKASGAAAARGSSLVPGVFGKDGERIRDKKQRTFREKMAVRRKAIARKFLERRTGMATGANLGSSLSRLKPFPTAAAGVTGKVLSTGLKTVTKFAFGFAAGLAMLGFQFAVAAAALSSVVLASGLLGNLFTAFKEGTKTIQSNFLPVLDLIIASLGAMKFAKDDFKVTDFLKDIQTGAKILLLSLAKDLPGLLVSLVKAIFTTLVSSVKAFFPMLGRIVGVGGDSSLEAEIAALTAGLGSRIKLLADKTATGKAKEDARLARITGIDGDPEAARKAFAEMEEFAKANKDLGGPKSLESRNDFLRAKGAKQLSELKEAAGELTERFKSASDVFLDKSADLAMMTAIGSLKPSVAGKAASELFQDFQANDPKAQKQIKLQEAQAEYTNSLIQQAKQLKASMFPQIQLNEAVSQYKEMLKRGFISQGTYNEAVAIATRDANQAETNRLNTLDEINNTKASGSSSVGQGAFFSKFNANFSSSQGTEQDKFRANLEAEEKVTIKWGEIGKQIQGKLPLALTALQEVATRIITPLNGLQFQVLKTSLKGLPNAAELATSALGDFGDAVKALLSEDFMSGKLASSSAEETRKIADKIPDPPKPAPEPPRPASVDQPRSSSIQAMIDKESRGFFAAFFMSASTNENRTGLKENDDPVSPYTSVGVGMGAGSHGPGHRANGGPVKAGGSYVVGEQGPELFFPTKTGHILSNGLSKKVDGMFADGTNDLMFIDAFRQMDEDLTAWLKPIANAFERSGTFAAAGKQDETMKKDLEFQNWKASIAKAGNKHKTSPEQKAEAAAAYAAQKPKAFDIMDYKKNQSRKFQERGGIPNRDPETGDLSGGYDLSGVSDADLHAMSIGGVSGIQPNDMSLQGELIKRSRKDFRKDLRKRREESAPSNPVDNFEKMQKKSHNLFEKKNKFIDAGGRLSQLEGLSDSKQNNLISKFLKKENNRVKNRELPESPMPSASDLQPSVATSARLASDDMAAKARERQRAQMRDRNGRMEEAKQKKEEREAELNARMPNPEERLAKQGFIGQNTNANRKKHRLAQIRARLAEERLAKQGFIGQNTSANRKKHRLAQIRARLAGHSPQPAMNDVVPDAPAIPNVDQGAAAKRAGQNAVNSVGAVKQLEMMNTALGEQTQLLSKIEGNTKKNGGLITS